MNKKIHYCWFGENPKTKTVEKCIESWRRFFPGWEICEWNESNFDVSINVYVQQAYAAKKWAFVSDYCRFWVLEKYGGLYFDTDVEVIRPFDDILRTESAFVGFETERFVAPGLVMYVCDSDNAIIRRTREYYDHAMFIDENGNRIKKNVCNIFTDILKQYGLVENGMLQKCGDFTVYPMDYFNPFDDATGVLHKTDNTYSIHWYDKTWMSKPRIIRNKCTRILHRYLGKDIKQKLLHFFDAR